MSFLKTLFRLDAASHVARGDEHAAHGEWGLAHLELERALEAWEPDSPIGKEQIQEKLLAARERAYERALERAAVAEEADDLDEAISFLEGARELLGDDDGRVGQLDERIEKHARKLDERSLNAEIEAFLKDQGTASLVQQRRQWEFSLYFVNPSDVDLDDSEKYTTLEIIELAAAAEQSPDDVNLKVDLGMALARSGFTRKAIAPLRRAAELAPQDKEIHYALGNIYADEGELDLAVSSFQRALTIDPKFALCYLYLAKTYLKAEDDDEAARYLDLAIEHADEESGIPEEARDLKAEIEERRAAPTSSDDYPQSLEERIP